MKKGKHTRIKFKTVEIYALLIFIVSFFMCVGYAQISDVLLDISGITEAESQEGVFITDVKIIDEGDSKINNYIATTLDSTVILNNNTPSVSYEISIYNNSNQEYIFIEALTNKNDITLYDNNEIEFLIDGLKNYDTRILPKQKLGFTITFKYKDEADISKNILNCKLNFRFKESPKLNLNNEGQTYILNDIYPDYIPEEFQFTVSNYYSDTEINTVPMTYSFITTIDNPLTAKIYDSAGKEVTSDITIDGDGKTKIENTYTLKIIWDNTISNENYNDISYSNKEFKCSVKLKAIPDNENYLEYIINKEFNVEIQTAKLNFNIKPSTEEITIFNDVATLNMTLNNYSDNNDYNKFDMNYEIYLENNDKYILSLSDENNGVIKGGNKNDNAITMKFVPLYGTKIENSEDITVVIKATRPYEIIVIQKITIKFELVKDEIEGIAKLTESDCSDYFLDLTNAGGYENLYMGNNGELEYSSDGAIVFDKDNSILYKDITDIEMFKESYSVYFTIEADLMQPNNTESYATALLGIGSGDGKNKSQNLLWVGFFKGYLHVISYDYGAVLKDNNFETVDTGYLSYNISEYSNKTFNIQIVGNKTGMTKVFINGNKITEFESGGKDISPEYISIGDLRPLRNLKFEGKVYDYAIYNKELTDEEVYNNWKYAESKWIK